MGAALRTEHVGSLLRPGLLIEERRRLAAGLTDRAALRAVEDELVSAAVGIQETIGLDVVGDGEFRREEEPDPVAEARFLATHTRLPFKISLPSPGWLAAGVPREDAEEVGEAAIRLVREQIAALVELGVPYVQLDNPGYVALLDLDARAALEAAGRRPDEVLASMLAADRMLLEGIAQGDTAVGLRLARRSEPRRPLTRGGYLAIAEELFDSLPVDRFLLPFVDGRAGGFECLRLLPGGKVAVLGLIDTDAGAVQSAEELMRQLDAAAEELDPDQLAISPRDGFEPRAGRTAGVTVDDQYRKLVVAVETAHRWFAG